MIPEFVGRLPVICPLMPLDVDALVQIMTEPRNALVKQYRKFFEMEGADLEFTPDALIEIAKKAKAKDTGARGLRSIVEDIMLDIMYELPDRAAKDKGRFVVTPEVVRKEKSLFDTPPVPLTRPSPRPNASGRRKAPERRALAVRMAEHRIRSRSSDHEHRRTTASATDAPAAGRRPAARPAHVPRALRGDAARDAGRAGRRSRLHAVAR